MEKLFATYEPSKLMKEIGFDEPCLAFFNVENPTTPLSYKRDSWFEITGVKGNTVDDIVSAPLYDQVFDWFEEKHNLYLNVIPIIYIGHEEISGFQTIINGSGFDMKKYKTKKEARESLILKAIKMVKEKQNENI